MKLPEIIRSRIEATKMVHDERQIIRNGKNYQVIRARDNCAEAIFMGGSAIFRVRPEVEDSQLYRNYIQLNSSD